MRHLVNRAASCLALVLALTAITHCESLASVSRPALELVSDKPLPDADPLDASFREFRLRRNESRSGISYAGGIPMTVRVSTQKKERYAYRAS